MTPFKDLQNSTTEVAALFKATRAVLEHIEFKDAALAVFNAAKDLVGATAGYVALLSKDGTNNELLFLDSGGVPCRVDPLLPMPIRGLREKAYSTGMAVYDNAFKDSEWAKFLPEGHAPLDNVLFAPMLLKGKAAGLIGLANKPGGFNEHDARMLSAFGDIAAIALSKNRALEALRESEERFRSLVEDAPEGFYVISTEGIITSLNPAFEDITGWQRDEWLGRPFSDIIHPDDLPVARKWVQHVLQGNKTPLHELRVLSKSGGYIIAEFISAPLIKNGGIAGVSGITRNISERKKLEEVIQLERDRLTSILSSMSDGVCIVNQEYNIEYVNPVLEKEFGPISENKCYEYFHDRTEVCPWCPNREVFVGKTFRWEGVHLKNQKTYDLIATPLKNPDGSISKLGLFRDITERKKMEEALRDSEERYRVLVNGVPDLIFRLSKDGIFLDFKGEERELYVPPDAFLGKKVSDVLPQEVAQQVMNSMEQTIKTGAIQTFEYQLSVPEGIRDCEARLMAIEDGFLVIVRDVTERKKAEEMLRASAEKIKKAHEEAVYAKEFFESLINHVQESFYVADSAMNVTYISPNVEELYGYTPDEFYKDRELWIKVVHPDDKGTVDAQLKKIMAGENYSEEYRIISKDGGIKWVLDKGTSSFDSERKLKVLYGTVTDITERKKMEEELQEKTKYLERFNRLMVGRELEMIKLKAEVNELLEKSGEPKKYEAPDEAAGV